MAELMLAQEDLLAEVNTPVLVHFDLWEGNILVDFTRGRPEVGGLIDGERSFWGDPIADFASLALFGDIEADIPFLTGYQQAGGKIIFDDRARRRLSLYRCYLYLVMLVESVPRRYSAGQRTRLRRLVDPRLRSEFAKRADVEALWEHLLAGDVSWVVSDHACCKEATKFGDDPTDVFAAKSGFGGTEYLLPGLVGEGRKRGLSMRQVAELTAWNPARRYGLHTKGDLAPGFDADIALVDPDRSWVIKPEDSESTQEYTPFRGLEVGSTVTNTFLRGAEIYADGKVTGLPTGQYVKRPTTR